MTDPKERILYLPVVDGVGCTISIRNNSDVSIVIMGASQPSQIEANEAFVLECLDKGWALIGIETHDKAQPASPPKVRPTPPYYFRFSNNRHTREKK